MSSIETKIYSFFHPLIVFIFLVEVSPWTIVDGGSMGDGVTTLASVTGSSSTTIFGALLTFTSPVMSSSDDGHRSWACLDTLLPHLLIR